MKTHTQDAWAEMAAEIAMDSAQRALTNPYSIGTRFLWATARFNWEQAFP
jgi:hypothetical protein